jgi:recombination protein RecT
VTQPFKLNEPIHNNVRYRQLLNQYQADIAKLLPAGVPVQTFMRTCLNAWVRTYNIPNCTGISILNAIAIAAQLGLCCNGVGNEGWLVAFRSQYLPDGWLEATFIPGYSGLIRLCYQSQAVVSIKGECVRQGDHFTWNGGSDGFVEHWWDLGAKRDALPIVGAWALAEMRDAKERIVVVMDKDAIDALRTTDNDPYSLMWSKFPDTGYRKTALRRLAKLLPKSPQLALAMTLEDRVDIRESSLDLSPLTNPEVTAEVTRSQQLLDNLKSS